MRRLEALRADFSVLRAMARGMPKASSHAERLAAFYAPQIDHYDRFRERLLQGREQLIAKLQLPDNAHLVDLGGGTGQVFPRRAGNDRIADLLVSAFQRVADHQFGPHLAGQLGEGR